MAQRPSLSACLLAACLLSASALSFAQSASGVVSELSIATNQDTRPSVQAAEKVLVQAYGKLGIHIKFFPLPTKRTFMVADEGGLDGLAMRLYNDGQGGMEKVDVPIGMEEGVVYTAGKHFEVHGYESLRPYLVGYVRGIPILDAKLKDFRTETAPNLESVFRKLAAGRTDVVIESRSSMCMVKKLGLDSIFSLEPGLGPVYGYHYLHKSHHELIPKLEEVLRQMQSDGSIKRIQDETLRDYLAACK
jgi:polar amino acid transport system substrate-binding protein